MALLLLLLLLLEPPLSLSQSSANATPPPPNYESGVSSVTAFILAVCLSISVVLFICYFQCRRCQDAAAAGAHLDAARNRECRKPGLDVAVIDSFPTMLYSEVKELKLGRGSLQCAVCLSEFEDADTLRLLPKCSHVFHPDCIDMWLDSHATCPVCRADLTPDPNAPQSIVSTVEDVVQVPVEAVEREDGDAFTEEQRERFTLRLPESVRREMMERSLMRSLTMDSPVRGMRRGGRGVWSFKMGRKDWAVKSDTWALLGKTWSLSSPPRGGRPEGESSSAAR